MTATRELVLALCAVGALTSCEGPKEPKCDATGSGTLLLEVVNEDGMPVESASVHLRGTAHELLLAGCSAADTLPAELLESSPPCDRITIGPLPGVDPTVAASVWLGTMGGREVRTDFEFESDGCQAASKTIEVVVPAPTPASAIDACVRYCANEFACVEDPPFETEAACNTSCGQDLEDLAEPCVVEYLSYTACLGDLTCRFFDPGAPIFSGACGLEERAIQACEAAR